MSSAVVIGAPDLLDALVSRASLNEEEALTFSDTEPLQALEAIIEHRPRLVVLERLFAATSRGAALINRLKSDPALADLQIRVLSHSGDYSRVIARPERMPVAVASTASPDGTTPQVEQAEPPLDWRGTRRAPRFRVRPGVELQLDGNPVALVDVSILGAQVISPSLVRPDQRVRVTVPAGNDGVVRFRGTIAWARFELPRRPGDAGPHYRAGVEFLDADADALTRFCEENQV
jgi:hypothetical protein